MDRFGLFPWSPLIIGTVFSVATFIAIAGFGAHPLILLAAAIGAATLDCTLNFRAQRRSGRY
jgi:hypothetical protein